MPATHVKAHATVTSYSFDYPLYGSSLSIWLLDFFPSLFHGFSSFPIYSHSRSNSAVWASACPLVNLPLRKYFLTVPWVHQCSNRGSGSRTSSSVQCPRPISQTAKIGAEAKLILQELEVARTLLSYKEIRLNVLFGFFKLSTLVQFSYFVSIMLYMDASIILGKKRETPENPSC